MLTDELKTTIQGYFSQLLENKKLQSRHGQRQMIAEIANTFSSVAVDNEGLRLESVPAIAVIEAGTGTGKTIAYMVPAIPVAQALGKKLVIATATVALQEQVMFKDIPDLLRNSDMRFSYALAKGRGRYLCLSKLDNQLRSNSSQLAMQDLYGMDMEDAVQPDHALYQEMLDALSADEWKGDRDDWPRTLEDAQWRNVSVEHGQCSGSRCSFFRNCCFFRSRESLQKADCIVANHDLVLADLSLGGGVILPAPEDTIYIFDEAHHLPVKSIAHFSHNIRLRSSLRWLEQLTAVFLRLQKEAGSAASINSVIEKAAQAGVEASTRIKQSLPVLEQYAEKAETRNTHNKVSQFVFTGGVVDLHLRELSHELQMCFSDLHQKVDKLLDIIRNCMESEGAELDRPQAELWFPLIGSINTRAQA
ncbi:MAG: DEAD/DEAH box helicase, partial [Pseudohongiellaceae bacterium]